MSGWWSTALWGAVDPLYACGGREEKAHFPVIRDSALNHSAGSSANFADDGAEKTYSERSSFAASQTGRKRRSPWIWIAGAAAAVVIILAAVLGGVLGSRANNDNKTNSVKTHVGTSGAGGAAAVSVGASTLCSIPSRSRPDFTAAGSASSSAAATAPAGAKLVDIVDLPVSRSFAAEFTDMS